MREVGFVPVSSGKQFGSARIYCKWLTFLKCADNASTDKNRKRCILYFFSDMAWVQASPCLDYSALHSWSEPRAIRHTTAPGAVITIHQMEWIHNWFCFFYASKRECEKKKKKNLQIFLYLLSFVMTCNICSCTLDHLESASSDPLDCSASTYGEQLQLTANMFSCQHQQKAET